MAIKTNWNEINQIIKEEFQRLMEKNKLKKRIQQINEELGKMDEEDSALEEVEASGTETVSSHAWTGEANGDKKFKPKFEKKGSHLLEDEEEETLEVGEEEGEDDLDLADEFAELGAAIEAKIKSVLGSETEGSEESEEAEEAEGEESEDNGEEFEEVEVENEPTGVEGNIEGTEDEDEEKEEVDEYAETQGGVGAEQGMTTDQALKKEGKNKTGNIIKESKENKPGYLNILSEGLDKNQKSALESEIERMRKLAKLGNNE